MASSNSAMNPDPLHILNDLKVMIQAIQKAHEASTAGLRQSINDLEAKFEMSYMQHKAQLDSLPDRAQVTDLRTLLSSHEQKFSEILRSPIELREQTNNTGMIELKLENRLDSLTNLESQLVSVKESVSQLCNDVEVATSQINEQDLTLKMLDAKFDAMDYKMDARKSAETAMQGELKRMDLCNRQLKDDHIRLNKELGLVQSNVENARPHCSDEHKKPTQGDLERLDSYNRQLRDEQVRLNNELKFIQSKVENAHLHCSEELKKSEVVLQAQIESNRNATILTEKTCLKQIDECTISKEGLAKKIDKHNSTVTHVEEKVKLNEESFCQKLQSSEERVDCLENERLSLIESIKKLESRVESICDREISGSSQSEHSTTECSIIKYQSDVESVILTQSTLSKTLEAIIKTQQAFENRLKLGQERSDQSHQQMSHQQKTIDTRIESLEKRDNINNLPKRLEASDSTSAISISPPTTPQLTGSTLDLIDPNSIQVINESDSRAMTLNDPESSSTRLVANPIIAIPVALNPDVLAVDSMDIDNQSDSSSRTQVPFCRGRDGSQASVIASGSSWVHQTANMERGNTTPNQRNTNAFSEPRLSNTRLPSTPNRRSTPVDVAFTPVDQNIRINPRSKPKLWVRPSRNSGNKLTTSLRKERDGMDPQTKDDDYNMSRATQKHFRYLSGVSREKHSFPRSPTREDLEALPDLPDGTAPLGLSAPYILKPSELSQQWDHDDEMGEGFRNRCEQRLRQYGLPYVGLSSVRNDPKAEEWNRRTLEYCLDTFNCAMDGLEYEDLFRLDRAEIDVNGIKDLMATHMRYRIDNKRIFLKDASNLKKHMQEDRRAKRAMNDLFLDRRYCSSDESDDEVLEQDRIRDIPIWRSRVGTALVEYIDAAYRQLRQDELPKRPGRKPGKRKTSTSAPVVGSSKWPAGLPSDCYDSAWVANLSSKDRKALKMKPAALHDVPGLLD